jgi:AcrR family transcriptional regulator
MPHFTYSGGMTKRVDPDVRREQVADAVIDEIFAHGVRSVTLARIAARTGLAIGSVRHYFGDTIREVMRFTLGVLIQRAQNRNPGLSGDPATRIIDVITFAAPTTEQERKENIALLEYRLMGRTDPDIAAEITAATQAAASALHSLLRQTLANSGVDESALQREALLLITLVEGFSLSAALSPTPLEEADVRAVVTATIERLRDTHPSAPESEPR